MTASSQIVAFPSNELSLKIGNLPSIIVQDGEKTTRRIQADESALHDLPY